MADRITQSAYKTSQVVVALPFHDLGDGTVLLDLDRCYWAGADIADDGTVVDVWVSEALSRQARGFSAGKVIDNANGTVTFERGD